ncbi:MAG: hypothetical protein ACD_30C00005G0054 [uncultured bacterium]|uniref:Uncharacterized protein n=4 Tax=Candidatus Daviesiibacteriota TaxID=1752718 RepID=A0A0G0H9G7_9BACT|nr:MAG: hypothetical protein ACD_30C00005G0054 [uncultured bacterium]KKQ08714.1 MAG: hypothetical protein US19_C0020G0003 [Candidatus Daviesbacteria bacterium GW2011_GWB1_36_5]KKQ15870.1 MAG: hypothetical protein US28_C0008G0002 [Candidatus Daviesbacteria bacterium GW2011_GWA1_36_8]OGE16672.1 MAG: hypothetical protein A2858_02435 [Candidatus Daviesbacteria bacterium RIFCSPHIGHO2_01_FULL_36_37]OGE31646.1 MAG: hypothetical protein A3C99_01840 [Candidatus Daviesbacteria bacterium RIFCSPHIGHO2_02_F
MESKIKNSFPFESKPILCRNLSQEVDVSIDALVAAKIYRSRDRALAGLVEEGLEAFIEKNPKMLGVIETYKEFQEAASKMK